jgi:deazaflavin-dependent oxidoreductase (nitroreductase family)
MAGPRLFARFNRLVTNRLTRPLAPYVPGFGVVAHTGRTTGRQYRTPVNVFRHQGGYLIALMHGADSEWVRNVVAKGGALETDGRTVRFDHPRIIHDEQRRAFAAPVRLVLSLFGVSDFLEVRSDGTGSR